MKARMRFIQRAAISMAAATALALALGAAPASANGAAGSSEVNQGAITGQGSVVVPQAWRYYDWYWLPTSCISVGKGGVKAGRWSQYQCIPVSTAGPWNLYVN